MYLGGRGSRCRCRGRGNRWVAQLTQHRIDIEHSLWNTIPKKRNSTKQVAYVEVCWGCPCDLYKISSGHLWRGKGYVMVGHE